MEFALASVCFIGFMTAAGGTLANDGDRLSGAVGGMLTGALFIFFVLVICPQ